MFLFKHDYDVLCIYFGHTIDKEENMTDLICCQCYFCKSLNLKDYVGRQSACVQRLFQVFIKLYSGTFYLSVSIDHPWQAYKVAVTPLQCSSENDKESN